jgi:hypothetical protein
MDITGHSERPAGSTVTDWCWLALAAAGMATLAILLVTFFLIIH